MSAGTFKNSMAAAAFVLIAGVSAPAMADSMNVSVNGTDGVFGDPNNGGLYFAGAIQYQDTTSGVLYNVFCDDPSHDVVVPGTYTYYVENESYAQNYLAPLETGSNTGTNNIANEIAALTSYGLSNPTNATLDEYVQLSIWKLEGASLSLSGAALSSVTALLGLGTSFWDHYWTSLASLGFSYGELVSPCTGGNTQITLNDCQTQGQLYIGGSKPPPNLIPEPGTLSLIGVGLLGVGGMWLRRKPASPLKA